LRVGKEAHEMRAVARLDMVTLQVQGNVSKGDGIAVDVQRLYRRVIVVAIFGGCPELTVEVLLKVGGG
jgi:hypothetical protein